MKSLPLNQGLERTAGQLAKMFVAIGPERNFLSVRFGSHAG